MGVLVGVWVFDEPDVIIPGPLPIHLGSGRYVALGDSFSSGEGLVPFVAGTQDTNEGGDRCHRSTRFAYPLLFTFAEETKTVFRACAGADVENIFDVVQEHGGVPNNQGLQVEPEIAGNDVKLVTVTIGGNDLDFAKVLTRCISHGPDCSQLPYKGYDHLDDWVDARLSEVKVDLIDLYGGLRAAFPDARILVLGYPSLFPPKAPPIYDVRKAVCTTLFEAWTRPEREAIRDWGFRLNGIILAATLAAEADIEYVDINSFFAGHEPCSTGPQWVRFVGLINDAARGSSFHPLADGYRMMARIVSCHLAIFPVADAPRTTGTLWAMTGCVAKEIVEVASTPAPVGAS